MFVADMGYRWVLVHNDTSESSPNVRRYPVESGWLYQVKCEGNNGSWHPPVFVPSEKDKEA